MLKRKNNKEELPNLLELTPEKLVDSEKLDDGTINLIVPRFRHKWIKNFFMRKLKKPTWKVDLDEIGSFVWEHIDGQTNVERIGTEMEQQFGEKVEPVYERLNQFLFIMRSHEFIKFREWSGKS
jgi:hypothetical protein